NPTVDDISKILGSVGIEVDAEKAKKVVDELNGKDIDEVIRVSSEKLASVPSGGEIVTAPADGGPAGGAPAAAPEVKESKKEEKKEEFESEDDMGFSLFD
ncbi:putative 60S acidic ribosomal protein P2-like protein, partial [Dinothrombium tinctorium]